MKEVGTVQSVSGDTCEVLVIRRSACGENCATCKGMCKAQKQLSTAKNTVGARVGDRVAIEADSKKVLKSAFLVYILPLIVFIAVFFTAEKHGLGGALSTCASAVGAAIVYVLVALYDRKACEFLPEVTEIL